MWDTAKDYRILIAIKARELFLRTVETGSFRGNWNKRATIDEAKMMESDLQSLLYCYLEGLDGIIHSRIMLQRMSVKKQKKTLPRSSSSSRHSLVSGTALNSEL